ncbi:Lrp/AsnC family transcriptional regulator [Shewanella aestuarii]|uniref:Lrp/AsnC family transcriptional regulator n=1 Tax=Shewanella aestuarii TaxID=1028752 RepID=A0A6G9QPX9_9GAMM|nr:Lrp/AsnC family transcriptional regulator [Shewanella aestuarii]QIR15879.1 Lrp/AsnC family transcriptional regulator [Shewanella aestuarii]
MDKFDKAIINQLRHNARQSVSTIAEQVNLSRSAVTDRIKKLESNRVIRGYLVLLSESQKAVVSAYFEIQHQCARCADVVHVFHTIPEIISCHGITGEMDLLVYVRCESMQRLHEIREHIDAQDDIIKVNSPATSLRSDHQVFSTDSIKTHVVLSEWINNHP